MGALAYKAGTPDMDPKDDPVSQSIKVGTWVQYRQHSGQKLRIRKDFDVEAAAVDEQLDEHIITITDSDVIGVFRDEAHAERFYDWV